MAYFLFARNILAGEPIEIFNGGTSYRDFTYVDDLVEGVVGSPSRRRRASRSDPASAPHPISTR